jgi:hypothetical protein
MEPYATKAVRGCSRGAAAIMIPWLLTMMLLGGCAAREEMLSYISAECEKAGYAPGTSEYKGCMRAKWRQSNPKRQNVKCYQYGNMMQCN